MTASRTAASVRSTAEHEFGDWRFTAVKDHILASKCACRLAAGDGVAATDGECSVCIYAREMASLPHLPDMVFPNNSFTATHRPSGVSIRFGALGALKQVDACRADPSVKVAPSKEWADARPDTDRLTDAKQFDWTFTTHYAGDTGQFAVTRTTEERIDLEKLKKKEPIKFYAEIPLFEDELADHGTSSLNLKFRCMPSGFFLLQRFYLRVDHVLVRIIDTRLYYDLEKDRLLREWSRREQRVETMSEVQKQSITDANTVWSSLPIVESWTEILTVA